MIRVECILSTKSVDTTVEWRFPGNRSRTRAVVILYETNGGVASVIVWIL